MLLELSRSDAQLFVRAKRDLQELAPDGGADLTDTNALSLLLSLAAEMVAAKARAVRECRRAGVPSHSVQ